VGCVPHLVRTGRHPDATASTLSPAFPVGTQVHADLAACVDHLLGETAAASPLS
jgi:D-glycero-D-manno-heptose 1,7-bisphosphate phosphatase